MLTNEQIRKNVAANFKAVRKSLGLTGRIMGEKLELSQKNYAAIEAGKSMTVINVYKLSVLTGRSIEDILLKNISDEIPKSNQ